jgi:hypothetical protein
MQVVVPGQGTAAILTHKHHANPSPCPYKKTCFGTPRRTGTAGTNNTFIYESTSRAHSQCKWLIQGRAQLRYASTGIMPALRHTRTRKPTRLHSSYGHGGDEPIPSFMNQPAVPSPANGGFRVGHSCDLNPRSFCQPFVIPAQGNLLWHPSSYGHGGNEPIPSFMNQLAVPTAMRMP